MIDLTRQLWFLIPSVLLSVGLVVVVGHVMKKNSSLFLAEAFPGNTELSLSVSRSLSFGYYLVMLGDIAVAYMPVIASVSKWPEFQMAFGSVGGTLLFLGFVYFFQLFRLSRIRNTANASRRQGRESLLA